MEPDEILDPRALALEIADEVDALIDALVVVCSTYVRASERETVCGSYIATARQITKRMRQLASSVGTNEDDAELFGHLAVLVTTETRTVADMLKDDFGWPGRFSVMVDRAAPGLVDNLESFAGAVQSTVEAGAAAADLVRDAMDKLKESEAKLAAAIATVVFVVIGGIVLYFAGPTLLASKARGK